MFNVSLWRQIYFVSIFAISFFLVFTSTVDTGQLTFCDQQSSTPRSLVFVSTLDGKISALDANNCGQKQWTLNFNDGPMLSSSIHRRELNNNGQWVRLIPSLNGGLYKFDGENLETVPISTEQLLRSSFRYSDDLVFSGGKETHSYGVSTNTGKILYECNVSGCTNNTDGEGHLKQEVLIIQRFQQTVRAVEPRTGIERWNFSVGQHDLVLVPSTNIYCPNKIATVDIEIKVIIPEGLIWAVNKNNPTVKLWQYKFDSPIVTIWRENAAKTLKNQDSLEEINLFDSSQWMWGSEYSTIGPSLYVGMHQRQLYVQENSKHISSLNLSPKYIQYMRYAWQPYPAVGTAIANALSNENNYDEILVEKSEAQSTTALSVLYNSEYINGNGFYLYSQNQLNANTQCNSSNPNFLFNSDIEKSTLTHTEEEENDTPVQIIIVSLWYWWKEVAIISFMTAILLNFMAPHFFNTTIAKDAILPPVILERHVETKRNDSSNDNENANSFKSRYLTDFEPINCLGKGGYGVVFEAKNKIDDCNYAIKRIALSKSQDSRERVMREVKALAKLDHQNIVRYFNAWLECPPMGWQVEHDQQWVNKEGFQSSYLSTNSSETESEHNDSTHTDASKTDPSVDSACEAYELDDIQDNNGSSIVFERSSEKQSDNDAISTGCDTETSDFPISNNLTEEVLSNSISTNNSESIVFEETDNKLSREKKFLISNKANNRKSVKMLLYIQMQLCQRCSLKEWLKEQTTRDSSEVLNIFQQIVDAVEYVHLQGLIHRDLKPSNIFFAFDGKIKIGDFGLVTAMTEVFDGKHIPTTENKNVILTKNVHTAFVGTHLYMSPEQMNGQAYDYKVDIYSLGIIFFELLIPFSTDMGRVKTLSDLRKAIFPKDFAENHVAEYNLLKMMLDEDAVKRPTTLGIKAKLPLQNCEMTSGLNIYEDSRWHFELPQLSRHSSITSSNSSESHENIS